MFFRYTKFVCKMANFANTVKTLKIKQGVIFDHLINALVSEDFSSQKNVDKYSYISIEI